MLSSDKEQAFLNGEILLDGPSMTAAALVSQRQMTLRTNSISLQAEQSFYCSEVFRFDINSLIFKFVFLSFSSLICYSNAVT